MAIPKAVENPGVFADGHVDVQPQSTGLLRQLLPLTLAHLNLVTHPLTNQQQAVALVLLPGMGELPLQPADHGVSNRFPIVPAVFSCAQPLLLRRLSAWLLPILLMVCVVLTGCSAAAQPPRSVLLQALELQIQLTQGAIADALALDAGGMPEVSRVRVAQQQPIGIGEAKGLRLQGQFDWRLAGDPIRVDSPFELFLQRGERGQSWRLARPVGPAISASANKNGADSQQTWITDPLPLKAKG